MPEKAGIPIEVFGYCNCARIGLLASSESETYIQNPLGSHRLFPALPEAGGAGGISLQLTELNGFGVAAAVAGVGAPSACGFGFFAKL
jgi:hypothetical protein